MVKIASWHLSKGKGKNEFGGINKEVKTESWKLIYMKIKDILIIPCLLQFQDIPNSFVFFTRFLINI